MHTVLNEFTFKTRSRGDQTTHDDIFLKSCQFIDLPATAALVRTLVVSWKEAAEMKLSVEREALVTPKEQRFGYRRLFPFGDETISFLFEFPPFDLFSDHEPRIAGTRNHEPASTSAGQ